MAAKTLIYSERDLFTQKGMWRHCCKGIFRDEGTLFWGRCIFKNVNFGGLALGGYFC